MDGCCARLQCSLQTNCDNSDRCVRRTILVRRTHKCLFFFFFFFFFFFWLVGCVAFFSSHCFVLINSIRKMLRKLIYLGNTIPFGKLVKEVVPWLLLPHVLAVFYHIEFAKKACARARTRERYFLRFYVIIYRQRHRNLAVNIIVAICRLARNIRCGRNTVRRSLLMLSSLFLYSFFYFSSHFELNSVCLCTQSQLQLKLHHSNGISIAKITCRLLVLSLLAQASN